MKYKYKSKGFNPKEIIELQEGSIIVSTSYQLDCNNHEYQKVGYDILNISWLEPIIDNNRISWSDY